MCIPGPDFAVNSDFPDAACNQLRVLGTKIQDQYPVLVNVLMHDLFFIQSGFSGNEKLRITCNLVLPW